MKTTTANTVELAEAIKLVCTNPASTFMQVPFIGLPVRDDYILRRISMEYPNRQEIPRKSLFTNYPIQGSFVDLERLVEARAMTAAEQKFYDELKAIASEYEIKILPPFVREEREVFGYSRAIREHANTVWLWRNDPKSNTHMSVSPTGRRNVEEEQSRALMLNALTALPLKGPERG